MIGLKLVTLAYYLSLGGFTYEWDTRHGYAPTSLVDVHGCRFLHQQKYNSKEYDQYSREGFKYRIYYNCPRKLPL